MKSIAPIFGKNIERKLRKGAIATRKGFERLNQSAPMKIGREARDTLKESFSKNLRMPTPQLTPKRFKQFWRTTK